jgi:hypothetical protein
MPVCFLEKVQEVDPSSLATDQDGGHHGFSISEDRGRALIRSRLSNLIASPHCFPKQGIFEVQSFSVRE